MSQEKSKTMPMRIFLGVEAVYYGIVEVVNWKKDPGCGWSHDHPDSGWQKKC